MPVAELHVTSNSALELAADVLLFAVNSTPEGPRVARTEALAGDRADQFDAALSSIGFRGTVDEVRRIPATFGVCGSIAVVGIGTGAPDANRLRYAAGSAARQLCGIGSLLIDVPVSNVGELAAVLEGAAIGAYSFRQYRSTVSDTTATANPNDVDVVVAPHTITKITVIAAVEDAEQALLQATSTATAVATVRDLVNIPASDLYPESFAERAAALVEGLAIDFTVLDEVQLAERGYGGIVAVGQGSARPPRLVKAVWNPAGASKHLALVGKGITFDSGGLSLKQPVGMVGMKYDMTGAATALAVVVAAASLALPVRVTAWMCLAENMPSGTATRPGDVITMKNGRTVEVLNTDAEGRLVLGDGLVAASAEHPDGIVDIATLTGAVSVALGNRYAAAMGEGDFVQDVIDAGARVGESLWRLPLPGELRSMLESDIADLTNVKIGSTAGGTLIAGIFLREFVGRTADGASLIPWAHLDIAGTAHNSLGGYGFTGKGPTGVAVRTLLEVAADFSRG